jgi:hypothetical protein
MRYLLSAEYYTQMKGIRKDTDERVLGGKESFCVNPFLADQKKCVYGEEKGMIAWDVNR